MPPTLSPPVAQSQCQSQRPDSFPDSSGSTFVNTVCDASRLIGCHIEPTSLQGLRSFWMARRFALAGFIRREGLLESSRSSEFRLATIEGPRILSASLRKSDALLREVHNAFAVDEGCANWQVI